MSRPSHELDQNYWNRYAVGCNAGDSDTVSALFNFFSINVRKKEDSNVSVLMRILTNYLQILAISLSYNLQFPSYMTSIFSSVESAGGAQDVFLSFD